MIRPLAELANKLGLSAEFLHVALAVVLTGLVLLVPSIAQWFDDRNP